VEAEIGKAAGKIWQALSSKGPMSRSALGAATRLPRDVLNQGFGWLAREGKLVVHKEKQGRVIGLAE
jgi:hypothetical protein